LLPWLRSFAGQNKGAEHEEDDDARLEKVAVVVLGCCCWAAAAAAAAGRLIDAMRCFRFFFQGSARRLLFVVACSL